MQDLMHKTREYPRIGEDIYVVSKGLCHERARSMRRPGRIALYAGGGSPYHHAAAFVRAGHDIDFVFPVDILDGALASFDAFVMPGGGYRAMRGQLDPLGAEGARAIRTYVGEGGMYLGSCAGSYCAATVPASFMQVCPTQRDLCLLEAGIWNDGGEEWGGLQSPGVGVLRARTVKPDHPVMKGMPGHFEIAHYNGPFFRDGEALAVVEGGTEHFTPAEQFLAQRSGPTLVREAAQQGIPNIVTGSFGTGRVVLFGSHPEFGFTLSMMDQQEPTRMLLNAVEWQIEESRREYCPRAGLFTDTWPEPERDIVNSVLDLAYRVQERVEVLQGRSGEPQWLRPAYAMSVFGLTPAVIWDRGLEEISRLAAEVALYAPLVGSQVLSFRPPPEWEIDGGYCGVLPLLEQADKMLAQALERWDVDLGSPLKEPYAFASSSPFHLVTGSYLAALGRVTSAALLCAADSRREASQHVSQTIA